ncbi:MAG: type I-C CRISPR-associated protein Cas8c/Csd1 [Mobilitalea sp.]
MKELYDTYENCSSMVGIKDNLDKILLPVAHSTQNAQVEIVIDLQGNFIRAEEIPKADAITIIPVTEDSGSRGNGINPHPLCDKLFYIAGDYNIYSDKEDIKNYFLAYISNLEKWCSSEYQNNNVNIVMKYLHKEKVISDLISCGLLSLDIDNHIDTSKKIQNIAATDWFVRFRISDFDLSEEGAVWKNKEIYQSFIDYIQSNQEGTDLCYVSGKMETCSYKHPAKIWKAALQAKLISANDEGGFIYRGRFANKEQAFSVGYVVSQKAHNTLRWLINRQGYTYHGMCLVAWEKNDKKLPELFDGTREMLMKENMFEMDSDIGYNCSLQLNRAIEGYKNQLDTKATIHVISLDAATPGRLSVKYYHVLNGSDFLERLKYWHETCMWEHEYWKEDNKTKGSYIGAPRTEDIVRAAFGIEQKGLLSVKDELMKSTMERLLPCILDKRDIPRDIVRAAINNISRPTAMEPHNWSKYLTVTCAMVKKQKNYMVEDWEMALNEEEKDRSYLYGRLLAVADRVEYLTYDRGEKRITNAKRYMQQFKNRPYTTWSIIENNIRPYFNKLKSAEQGIKYEHLLDEIHNMMDICDYTNNTPLDGLYLLGFHCQAKAFYNKSVETINEEEK